MVILYSLKLCQKYNLNDCNKLTVCGITEKIGVFILGGMARIQTSDFTEKWPQWLFDYS